MKYYKPGMLSLVFIPLLCLPFLHSYYYDKYLTSLKVSMPEQIYSKPDEEIQFWNYSSVDRVKKITKFSQTNLCSTSEEKLDSIFNSFYTLKSNKRFLSSVPENFQQGIKVKLEKHSSYEQLVNLFSLCEKYNFDYYVLDIRTDEFYIWQVFNEPKEESVPSTISLLTNCIVHQVEISKKNVFREIKFLYQPVIKSIHKTKFIFLSFCSLTILSIGVFRNNKSGF
jgi:hypothetical protein